MLVRFYVDYRIKPHVPPLEQIPANSVKFLFCNSTPQVDNFYVNLAFANYHVLRCRLLGSLILFISYTLIYKYKINFC